MNSFTSSNPFALRRLQMKHLITTYLFTNGPIDEYAATHPPTSIKTTIAGITLQFQPFSHVGIAPLRRSHAKLSVACQARRVCVIVSNTSATKSPNSPTRITHVDSMRNKYLERVGPLRAKETLCIEKPCRERETVAISRLDTIESSVLATRVQPTHSTAHHPLAPHKPIPLAPRTTMKSTLIAGALAILTPTVLAQTSTKQSPPFFL